MDHSTNANDPSQRIVRSKEWAGGLRCMDCHTALNDGDAYSERLSSLLGDTPMVEIVCVPCALRGAVSTNS